MRRIPTTSKCALGLGSLTLLTGMSPLPSSPPGEKPNLIFIITDDQRWDALGFAGNDIIHTPEMDRLASEGTYFRNAFVTTPICAASRASLMTGLYEREHDFTFGTPPLAKELVDISYPAQLQNQGYTNGYVGKFGMQFENSLDTSLFEYYKRPGEQFWATTYYRLTDGNTKHRHLTTEIGDLSLNFIDQYKDVPFCLTVSFHAPHAEDVDPRQYIYPVELDSLYQDVTIPGPALSDDRFFEEQPLWVRNGFNRDRWYWRFDTPEKYQEMVKGYYRMISGVDREIGRIRRMLEENGLSRNTIIVLIGDNGYFLGERQLAGKWLMYDNSLRVPLIVYQPGSKPSIQEEMVLNIDVPATLIDFAGIPLPEKMSGLSLKNLVGRQTSTLDRDHFLCEHWMKTPKIPKSEGIRTENWKYFRYADHPGHEELYDLKKDPEEIQNLVGDPKYLGILDSMRALLESYPENQD